MDREKIIKELEDVILDVNLFLTHEFGNQFGTEIRNKVANLSSNQQMALFLVEKKGINHVKDLANYLNISTSAVSQMVGKLEQLDMLERKIDLSNRRNTLIEIGPKGRELLDEMDKIKSTIFNKYLAKMEANDLLTFKNSFQKFLEIMIENKGDHQ